MHTPHEIISIIIVTVMINTMIAEEAMAALASCTSSITNAAPWIQAITAAIMEDMGNRVRRGRGGEWEIITTTTTTTTAAETTTTDIIATTTKTTAVDGGAIITGITITTIIANTTTTAIGTTTMTDARDIITAPRPAFAG